MTLLFIDGFDHYATADLAKKGWSAGSSLAIAAAGGRRGGGSLRGGGSSGNGWSRPLPSAPSTVVAGLAMWFSSLSANDTVLAFTEPGASRFQIGVRINADRTLSVYRGADTQATSWTSAVLLGTTTVALALSTWHYLEFKALIHASAGSYELRLNGVSILSGSGVQTKNSNAAAATVGGTYVSFGAGSTANAVNWDDLYICDTAGSTNNDFLGDVRVDTLYPNADGSYSQFTPSTGTTHYTLVDETAPNTTDYNDGASVGDRDSYGFQDLSALTSSTVYGVQVNAGMYKDDSGTKSGSTFTRQSGTNADGASAALGTSLTYVSQIYETKPAGGAWTDADVNAAEFGVRVTA